MGFELASLASGFGIVAEPFPEWYPPGVQASARELAPSGTIVSVSKITTRPQAQNYAAAGWKAAKTSTAVINGDKRLEALRRYRFVYDMVNWGNQLGVTADQQARWVEHLKKHLRGADATFDAAKGISAPRESPRLTTRPSVELGPSVTAPAPLAPASPAPISAAGLLPASIQNLFSNPTNLLLIGGAILALVMLSRR